MPGWSLTSSDAACNLGPRTGPPLPLPTPIGSARTGNLLRPARPRAPLYIAPPPGFLCAGGSGNPARLLPRGPRSENPAHLVFSKWRSLWCRPLATGYPATRSARWSLLLGVPESLWADARMCSFSPATGVLPPFPPARETSHHWASTGHPRAQFFSRRYQWQYPLSSLSW